MNPTRRHYLLLNAAATVVVTGATYAAPVIKQTTGTALGTGSSWIGGTVPGSGDAATWLLDTDPGTAGDQTSLGGILTLAANTSWGGIEVTGSTGSFVLIRNSSGGLTLGSGGVTVSGDRSLTLDSTTGNGSGTLLTLGADQTWDIGTGRTFTVQPGSGVPAKHVDLGGRTITKTGVGIAKLDDATLNSGTFNVNQGLLWLSGTAESPLTVNVADTASHRLSGLFNHTVNLSGGRLTLNGGTTMAGIVNLAPSTVSEITTGSATASSLANLSGSGTASYSLGFITYPLVLTGPNAGFTGTSQINQGIVGAGTNTSFGSGTIEITSFGSGAVASSDATARTFSNPVIIAGNGAMGVTGSGFGSGDLTFTGGVTIGSGIKTLTVNNALTEFSGVVAGSDAAAGLTKSGPGTLKLSGANTYTGTTTVSDGTLSITNPVLADTSSVVIGATGVLNLPHGAIDQVASLTVNGVVKGRGVYDATTDPGFITGTGQIRVGMPSVIKQTTGTALGTGSSWIGGTVPGSGDIATWLLDTDPGTAGDLSSLGGILTLAANTSWGGIEVTGSTGSFVLIRNSSGGLTLGSGGVTVSGDRSLTLDSTTGNGSGTLLTLGADQTWDIGTGRTFTVQPGSGVPAKHVDLGGRTITKTGVGIAKLDDATLNSGTFNVNQGLLWLSGTAESPLTVNVAATGSHRLSGVFNHTVNLSGGLLTLNGGTTMAGTVTFAPSTVSEITTGSATASSLANLSGSGTAKFLLGFAPYTLVLTGANAGFTGTSQIDQGIVAAGTNTSFGSGTIEFGTSSSQTGAVASSDATARTFGNAVSMAGNGTVGVTGSGFGSGNLTFTGDVALSSGSKTLTVNNAQTEFSGAVTGVAGGLTKDGEGTLILSGANTYTGTTTVSNGTLSITNPVLADTSSVVIGADGVLNLPHGAIDDVAALTVNGVAKPNGVYDATTDPGFITGTGQIRVGSVATGYSAWIAGFPVMAGVNDGPEQDADGDGIKNALEYVFGGIPAGPGSNDLSTIQPTSALTTNDLKLTFRRSDLSEVDATVKVQWSTDLVTWNDLATIGATDALPAVDITEDSPTVELDTVDVIIPRTFEANGRLFGRVIVTLP